MEKQFVTLKKISVSKVYKLDKNNNKKPYKTIGLISLSEADNDHYYVNGNKEHIELSVNDNGGIYRQVRMDKKGNKILSIGGFIPFSLNYELYKTPYGFELELVSEEQIELIEIKKQHKTKKRKCGDYKKDIAYIYLPRYLLKDLNKDNKPYYKVTESISPDYNIVIEAVSEKRKNSKTNYSQTKYINSLDANKSALYLHMAYYEKKYFDFKEKLVPTYRKDKLYLNKQK